MVLVVVVLVALVVIAVLASAIRRLTRERDRLGAALAAEHRDVTERGALEQAKSDFLATASHELRSPLTSLKGFVELLENGSGDGHLSDREHEFVEIIRRSTDRLVELVDELLQVAQIDADRVELRRGAIDVGEAIREVAEAMGPRLAAKSQRLGIYVAPTLPLAFADAGRLRQMIGNLLTNAHLYTPAEGRIHIGAEADRAWVRIVIADSGVGMSASEAPRIFDRFYRAPSGTAAAGTGLGLSIVKSLVDLHGGEIDVTSRPGVGTTFQVRLPATRPPAGSVREALRGRRVLVVADDPGVGELIASELTLAEAEAEHLADDARVLAALAARPVDAVCLQARAPGHAIAARIRAERAHQAIPIVFAGAQDGDRGLVGEWTVGAPIDGHELRAVLAAAVRAGRSRVLVVARPELQTQLEPALDERGIEYEWECSGTAAARACTERRFELALVDAGLRNPEATLEALALRRRRLRHAVILFSDAGGPAAARAGREVVGLGEAPDAVLAALRGDRDRHAASGVADAIR